MSLILRVAVQQEAIRDNPVRHLDPIEAGSRKPRALTTLERRRFLAWMQGTSEDEEEARAQAQARRRDLLEGVPVVDGDEPRAVPIVAITGNVVRHRGEGLHRHAGRTETALRIVPLPRFVVDMLARSMTHAADRTRSSTSGTSPNGLLHLSQAALQDAPPTGPTTGRV